MIRHEAQVENLLSSPALGQHRTLSLGLSVFYDLSAKSSGEIIACLVGIEHLNLYFYRHERLDSSIFYSPNLKGKSIPNLDV